MAWIAVTSPPAGLTSRGSRKISGCSDDPQEMVGIANEIQAVMYGCLFEETRRQWPHASMGLNWCYNEPWPTGAGNGLAQ